MPEVKKLTKLNALYNLYNQAIQELTVAQFNVKIFARDEILDTGIDSELSKNLTHWRMTVSRFENNIKILLEMIADEEKQTAPEKELN